MSYIALKPCKFDKAYKIDEVIPDEVIDPNMVYKLIKCGLIMQSKDKSEKVEVISKSKPSK